jgi:hypothetical protein
MMNLRTTAVDEPLSFLSGWRRVHHSISQFAFKHLMIFQNGIPEQQELSQGSRWPAV